MMLYKFFVILIKIGIFQVFCYNIIFFLYLDICRYQKEVLLVIVVYNKFVLVNIIFLECYYICNLLI